MYIYIYINICIWPKANGLSSVALGQPMLYVQSVVEYYTYCTLLHWSKRELLLCQTSSCHIK